MYHLAEFLNTQALHTPNYVENLLKTAQSKNITVGEWNMFIKQFKALISQDSQTYIAFQAVLKDLENATVQIPYKLNVGVNPNTVRQEFSHAGQMAFRLGNGATRGVYELIYSSEDGTEDEFKAQVLALSNKLQEKEIKESGGLLYTVRLQAHRYDCGKVIDVTTYEEPFRVVLQTNDSSGYDTSNAGNLPLMWFLDAPEIGTYPLGDYSFAEGLDNYAQGLSSHAEGRETEALGWYAHSEGLNTISHYGGHAEGKLGVAIGDVSHVEGVGDVAETTFNIPASDLKEYYTAIENAHDDSLSNEIYRINNTWSRKFYDAEGKEYHKTGAYGKHSHVENFANYTSPIAAGAHAEGHRTCALNIYTHAEGYYTVACGELSHAEGSHTVAWGKGAHAEGWLALARGDQSHAEGWKCMAAGFASHAEGAGTEAYAKCSHAAGRFTRTSGDLSNPQGGLIGQFVVGDYNKVVDNAMFIVGKGTSDTSRKNLFEIRTDNSMVLGDTILTETKLKALIKLVS